MEELEMQYQRARLEAERSTKELEERWAHGTNGRSFA
jgi:hypothetical protein